MTRPAAPLDELLGRALGAAAPPAGDDLDRRALAAAIDVLVERGTEHATMDDIARVSGIGRATLFRRFGGKDQLLERALTAEVRGFLDEVARRFTQVQDPTDRIAEAFVACLRLTDRPLLRDPDPQRAAAIIAALGAGDSSPVELARRFVGAYLAEGQRTGVLPTGDPPVQADAMVRLALAYLVLPGLRPDPSDEDGARRLARLVFAPIAVAPQA